MSIIGSIVCFILWYHLRAIFFLSLAFITTFGPVYAQNSGPIEVLNYHSEVDFPDGLIIGVTAEGQHEIVEVRVNYRAAGAGVWSYGYSDFDPGRQVISRFSIPTSGASYIPPGARVEHYYLIQDSVGNVYETPVQVTEYSDTRFEWEQTRIGLLTLLYHDIPQSRVDALSRELEGEIQRVNALLQLEEQQLVRGIIYNGFAEAVPAFPTQSRTITQEEVFHGFAFSTHRVFLGVGLQPRLIVHETAHLMLAQALGPGAGRAPSWLDEGFATYVEPGSRPFSGQSLSSQGPSLRAMSTVSGTPEDINNFYLKAESVVAFLIDEYGTPSFQQFLGELRQGRNVDAALVNIYGFDTDGLEANWAASPLGRSSPSPERPYPATPFVLFNSWLLGGLVLIVMTLVFVRYLVRKLRYSAGDEDGLDSWDD